jgi:hypothetical protein
VGSCCSIFIVLCIVLWIVVLPFVPILLAIVLSVLLKLTASDYPFGIIKIFFHKQIALPKKLIYFI